MLTARTESTMTTRGQNAPAPTMPMLYRPAEVAKMLRCSEWWVKEQARNRRIPFSWIGGSYRFTDEHVAEIVRLSEVSPTHAASTLDETADPRKELKRNPPKKRLTARTPRRAVKAAREVDAA
jgi:hypothetical protein